MGANVLIGLTYSDLQKYSVSRESPLPSGRKDPWESDGRQVDLATSEGKYPNSLFNKGVRAKNEDHVGHVMKETSDKIVVFGEYNKRYDIPKAKVFQVGMNVVLKIDYPQLTKHEVSKNSPVPSEESVETLGDEPYPEDYHGPR